MFASSVQTSPLSLFSSTSTQPFTLFSLSSNHSSLPEDAGIVLIHDGTNERIETVQAQDSFQLRLEKHGQACLNEIVAHIQSPTIQKTFIRCPPTGSSFEGETNENTLGIKLCHVHFQLRSLGPTRPFNVEVGIQDHRNTKARIRCSTFQSKAIVYPAKEGNRRGPLLHLPLVLPQRNDNTLTDWMTLSLSLDSLISHFNNQQLLSNHSALEEDFAGGIKEYQQLLGQFSQVDYIEVHANIRLRRIWFTSTPQHEATAHNFPLPGLRMGELSSNIM